VYPSATLLPGQVITAESFPIKPHLRHLYAYLLENRLIQGITNYDPEVLMIRRLEVLRMIKSQKPGWDKLVPPPVAKVIRERGMFGLPVG
jgi:hypothetical protein